MGALAAAKRRSWWDRLISGFCTLVYSIPDFWLALIVQLSLAYWIRLFPVSGTADPLIEQYGGGWLAFTDRLRHLALPVLTMTLIITAIVTRFQRAALIDVLPSDYVRTARAKGASERTVITRHALRNALTPTITVLGLLFPTVLGGAFFIEYVFGWHGLGWLAVTSVSGLDYDVATGGRDRRRRHRHAGEPARRHPHGGRRSAGARWLIGGARRRASRSCCARHRGPRGQRSSRSSSSRAGDRRARRADHQPVLADGAARHREPQRRMRRRSRIPSGPTSPAAICCRG